MPSNAKAIAVWSAAMFWFFVRGFIEIGAAILLLWGGLWAFKYPWPDSDWLFYGLVFPIYVIIDFTIFLLPKLLKKTPQRC